VNVIALHGIVHEPESKTFIRHRERSFQSIETDTIAQRADLTPHAHSDVHRKPPFQNRTRVMPDTLSLAFRLRACTAPLPTPRPKLEPDLAHLDSALNLTHAPTPASLFTSHNLNRTYSIR
jgi:hypothetical protein